MDKVTPAHYVITLFGGPRSLTRMLNEQMENEKLLYPSTIQRWCEGVNAGKIPSKYHDILLAIADQRGLTLTPEILVRGASEKPVTVARSKAS